MSDLQSKSSEEIADIIRGLGNDYEDYGDLFESSDIDGATIESLSIDEIADFVKDMNITNTVHRAKIKGTIKKLIQENDSKASTDGINININNTNNNASSGQFVEDHNITFYYGDEKTEGIFTGTLNNYGTPHTGKVVFDDDECQREYIGDFKEGTFLKIKFIRNF